MANKALIQELDGTPAQITLRDATDFAPAAANDLRHASAVDVEVQLDFTSVADGAARQSAKFDFGENRAREYWVRAALEFAATPTAGDVVYIYLAPSQHATAANGNPGGVSGSDSAYSGYSSNMAASALQLLLIGVFVCTAQATGTVQQAMCGRFSPPERYGTVVLRNESNAALHSDAVEMHITLDPIIDELQ